MRCLVAELQLIRLREPCDQNEKIVRLKQICANSGNTKQAAEQFLNDTDEVVVYAAAEITRESWKVRELALLARVCFALPFGYTLGQSFTDKAIKRYEDLMETERLLLHFTSPELVNMFDERTRYGADR